MGVDDRRLCPECGNGVFVGRGRIPIYYCCGCGAPSMVVDGGRHVPAGVAWLSKAEIAAALAAIAESNAWIDGRSDNRH